MRPKDFYVETKATTNTDNLHRMVLNMLAMNNTIYVR
jgi:hypothetical protein